MKKLILYFLLFTEQSLGTCKIEKVKETNKFICATESTENSVDLYTVLKSKISAFEENNEAIKKLIASHIKQIEKSTPQKPIASYQ